MNNKHGRVLAYSLAKEISNEELNEVSGGSFMTSSTTFGPTGSTGQVDGYVDIRIDW